MFAGRNISSHGERKITYADFTIEYKSMNPGVIRNIKYMHSRLAERAVTV